MKQRAFILLSLSVLLLSMFVSLFHPGNALALAASDIKSGSYAFQDRANIIGTIDGKQIIFTDADINDGTNGYAPATGNGICNTHHGTFGIVLSSNPDWGASKISGNLNVGVTTVTGANSQCDDVTGQVPIDNTGDKANYKLEYNSGNITTLPGQTNSATYTGSQPNAPSDFYYSSDKNADFCPNGPSALIANGSSGTLYCLQEGDRGVRGSTGASNTTPVKGSPIDGLVPSSYDYISSQQTVGIFGTVGSTPPGATSTSTSTNSSAPSLSCNAGFNPLNWLICGVINGLVGIVGDLDNLITGLLSVGSNNGSATPSQIFCSSGTCNDYYNAWSSFRDIALGLLVVIGLMIVIAEALGVEALDAYTVRKVMPRLVIAVIFITLSWQIMEFFIELSNALGFGIRFLIYKPFDNLGNIKVSLGGGGGVAVDLASGAAITAMGIFGLLSFIATAALAVFVAFLVLVIRQLVIIMLVILAPIAILAYILPNTQNVFKIWWDSFSRALMMFPLIAGFIAIGRVFSAVAASGAAGQVSGSGTTAIDSLVAFAAYFAPYFLIPATFKFAGGALRQIGGFVNDRHRGAFDRIGQFRKGQLDTNLKKMSTGDRWQGNNVAAKAFNRTTAGVGVGYKGRFGLGARGKGALDLQRRVSARNNMQNNAALREMGFDDNAVAVMALSGGTATGARRAAKRLGLTQEEENRAVGTAQSVGFNNSNVIASIGLMAQNKSRKLVDDPDKGVFLSGQAGIDMVRESAARVSGGNQQLSDNIMGDYAFNSRNAGRLDLGGEAPGESAAAGWARSGVQQHAQAFDASTGYYTKEFANTLLNQDSQGNAAVYSAEEKAAAAVAMSEMHASLPAFTSGNQEHINAAMDAIGVDHNSNISVERQIANIANGRLATDDTVSGQGNVMGTVASGQLHPVTGAAILTRGDTGVSAGPQVITANEINGKARKYGQNIPESARGAPPPGAPGAGPTPPAGTTGP